MVADEITQDKFTVEQATEALIGEYAAAEAFSDLDDEQMPEPEKEEALRRERVNALAFEITNEFRSRKSRRSSKEDQWFKAESLYLGAAVSSDGSQAKGETPFTKSAVSTRSPTHNAIQTKVDTIVSVHWSMQFAAGEKNWDFLPPEAPFDVHGAPIMQQEAAAAADKFEAIVADQLEKCRYGIQARKAMRDRAVLGTGVLKGPINSDELHTRYDFEASSTGETVGIPKVSSIQEPIVRRVNPWFFFPDDTAVNIRDSKDSIELHPMSLAKLDSLKLLPGFIASAIDEARALGPTKETGGDNNYMFTNITDINSEAYKGMYEVVEYHGPVTLSQMNDLSLTPSYDSPSEMYYAEIWVCNNIVLKAVEENIEGCFRVPYYTRTWKDDPGSIFGIGLPIFLADQQKVVEVAYKMLLDNTSLTSGPQVVVDRTKVVPANNKWELNPDKIWYVTEPDTNVQNAVYFFVPPNVSQHITNLLQLARGLMEDEAAMPGIGPTTQSAQAIDTAYGMKQAAHNSTTVAEMYNEEWDDDITTPLIKAMFAWNIQYGGPNVPKMNFVVDVRTSSEYRSRQMYIAELEKLSLEASQNPELGKIINKKELSKARLSMMQLPFKNIVKTDAEIAADEEAEAQRGPPPEIALKMAELEIDKQRLALDERRLEYDAKQKMQQLHWDNEERMAAAYARLREAESSAIKAMKESETEMLKLAQKDGADKAAIMAMIAAKNIDVDAKKFLSGVDYTLKAREQLLTQQELEYAKKEGKGI